MKIPTSTEDQAEIVTYAVDLADSNGLVEREGRIDWEDTLCRIESHTGFDLGSDADSPLIRRIKREVRKARAES